MLRKAFIIAGLLTVASTAQATVTNTFAPGTFGFQVGDIPVNDFSSCTGFTFTGSVGCYTGLTPGVAAPPAGDLTQYLAVLGGGSATFLFGDAQRISFDVGSVDDFNSVTLTLLGLGGPVTLTGSQINGNSANGNQTSSLTNGRLTIFGTAGETFTGLTLTSGGNSFEIDNLAVSGAVPEASTWAMFLVGFGALGVATRRRTRVSASLT
jgi:hypothetical protein